MIPGIRAFLKEAKQDIENTHTGKKEAKQDIEDTHTGTSLSTEQYLESLEPVAEPKSAAVGMIRYLETLEGAVEPVTPAEQVNTSSSSESEELDRQMGRIMALSNAQKSELWALAILLGMMLTMGGAISFGNAGVVIAKVASIAACCIGVTLIGLGIKRTAGASRTAEMMKILTQTEDPRLAPYIIDLMFDNLSARRAALLRVLPKLSVRDAQRLRSEHWQSLHNQLVLNDTPLIIAILEVIERCGSIGSLRYVSPLAAGKFSAKQNAHIRELAQACQTKLQARIDGQSAPQQLLRGSAAPTAETLLRPSMENTPTAPQQLLRAAESEKVN